MHIYIPTKLLFHMVCKSKEYDCNAFVSIYWCPLVLDWKPTMRFQNGQPSHPLRGCEVGFVYATTVLRMSWGPVLVSVLLYLSSLVFSWTTEMGFFYPLLDSKSKSKYFSFAIMNHGSCLKQVMKTLLVSAEQCLICFYSDIWGIPRWACLWMNELNPYR